MQSELIVQDGRSELKDDLARTFYNRGKAFLRQERRDAATKDLEEALAILTRLVEDEGRSELKQLYFRIKRFLLNETVG